MIYEFKHDSRIKRLDAQVVGETLERIRQRDGGITADAVVADARPATSPLHGAFEWNNRRAADEYRRVQARHLVRSVVIRSIETKSEHPIRAFVVVRHEEGGDVYTSTISAMQNEFERAQVLRRALRELDQCRRRYQALGELAEIWAAIDAGQTRMLGTG